MPRLPAEVRDGLYRVLDLCSGDREVFVAECLFNEGFYFDCHEYLEGKWRQASGERKTTLQGLIQIAAGYHKLELDPRASAGARELVSKGLEKLKGGPIPGDAALAELSSRPQVKWT